jgi:CubicO group peptidase (beta-lactamase class C family)
MAPIRLVPIISVVLGFLAFSNFPAQVNPRTIDQIFAGYDRPGSPGCVLGVIRDGRLVYRKGYGLASLEFGVPLSPQSVFYLGSVSKQFTAAAVVLAAEQGFLSLDDDVRKYLPKLPDYGHPIILRQMLHHTSGLRDFMTPLYLAGRHEGDLHSKDEMIDLISRQKGLNNIPGDEFLYSNTNYFLLGEVVLHATKMPLAEFAKRNIFEPLGMAHTRFYDDHSIVLPNRVPAYDPGKDGNFFVNWSTYYDTVGAGGLMSSLDDLLLWDRNFYDNRLGKGTLVRELQTRGILNNGKQISYALGLELRAYRGLPIVEHNGGLFGYRTRILRFPEERSTIVCLCNLSSADEGSLSRRVADICLQKSLQAEPRTQPSSLDNVFPDPSLFAGKYLDRRKHSIYSFTASGGKLMAWGSSLRRLGPNRFNDLGSGIITFEEVNGRVNATLEVDRETFFTGDRVRGLQLSAIELAGYAGEYRSAELDATYSVRVNKGLELQNRWTTLVSLEPVGTDEFAGDGLGMLVLRRDETQRVT